jgi:hypothetical protein
MVSWVTVLAIISRKEDLRQIVLAVEGQSLVIP